MTKQYTISKSERLKSRKEIESLFSSGIYFSTAPFKTYYSFANAEKNPPGLIFGIGVSSRHFKKAVDRNRIKRLIREGWRLRKSELQQTTLLKRKRLHVFVIYTGKAMPDFEMISSKIQAVINKLSKIIHEDPAKAA